MKYKLCTAEKPSVAADIARVIGANDKKEGYFEGNGYRVTWAVGHLVTLAEPEAYGEEYKNRNNIELLPIIPEHWKFDLIENVKSQFYVMKKLMNDDDCEFIIDCGDMGETGHYLQWLIRQYAGTTKEVKRFCATSMTDEAIKEAMNNLRNIEEFEGIIRGALCKAKGDWIVGMSFSRLFSAKYNSNLTVGRVQTPTLYFVYKRWLDVKNFKPQKYYQIQVDFEEGFKAWYIKDTENKINATDKDNENRIINREYAEALSNNFKDKMLGGGKGTVTEFTTKNKATDRPQLYDITELERDGNRIYGYTASKVLETAQSLYEKHKVMTYPRTDSRYITTDLEQYMEKRIKDISTIEKYKNVAMNVLEKGLNIDKKIVDDSKVTDHHALLVTEKINSFDFSKLNQDEKNILDLVISRMLVAFSHKYLYKETTLEVTLAYQNFKVAAKGKMPINQGWKEIQKMLSNQEKDSIIEKDEINEQVFPQLEMGKTVNIGNTVVLDRTTTAPKLHTEATLLTAMENAGSIIKNNDEYRQILKGHGIGTQATRAEIIKKLFDVGYIMTEKKGKINYLIPTKKGYSAVKVFPVELLSPVMTAEWESKISRVADDKDSYNETDFMNEFKNFMYSTVEKYKNITIEGINFLDKEILGKCLWCGDDVCHGRVTQKNGEKKDIYYCINKQCKFSFFKDDLTFIGRTGRGLSKTDIKKLLKNKTLTVKCKSKTGKEYDGYFEVTEVDGYARFKVGFPPTKTKSSKKK